MSGPFLAPQNRDPESGTLGAKKGPDTFSAAKKGPDTFSAAGLELDADGAVCQVGRWRIVRELGRGGSGIVYLAWDPLLHREVAVKVPQPEVLLTPEMRRRFLREARAAAGFDHPNLVPVYEAGEVGPFCYIVSAYCPGTTLGAWLKQQEDLVAPRLAVHLVTALTDAVAYIHGRGVLHRDIKPNNILLQTHFTAEDAEERRGSEAAGLPLRSSASSAVNFLIPKLTDFSLAQASAEPGGGNEEQHGAGYTPVHGAGAGRGTAARHRPAHGYLRSRCNFVRAAHGPPAVSGGFRNGASGRKSPGPSPCRRGVYGPKCRGTWRRSA